MVVSINQPAYLPWLGYFERIAQSDIHVILDHVQFEKNSFVNRNKVPGPNGPVWLTVPVSTKGKFGDLAINKLQISNGQPWAKKQWRTIKMIYQKSPFFADHAEFFEDTYQREWKSLSDLCYHFTNYLLEHFDIKTKLWHSSDIGVSSINSDMVLDLCKALSATKYISGAQGRDYLESEKFSAAGIEIEFQDYQHPGYKQVGVPQFIPLMSSIDLLFNHGPNSSAILLNQDSTHVK